MKYLIYYIIIINVISFLIYGLDKLFALLKKNRISERVLFILSFFGGCIGALIGMIIFRHKIRKVKFYIWNILMIGLWSYIIYMFIR